MKYVISLPVAALALMIGACSTTQVSPGSAENVPSEWLYGYQAKTEKSSAAIVVTRDSGRNGAGCPIGFLIDGKVAARIDPGQTARFYVEPREHILGIGPLPGGGIFCGVSAPDRREISTNIGPSEEKYFRISVRSGEDPALEPTSMR
jgi:hypothetical protein